MGLGSAGRRCFSSWFVQAVIMKAQKETEKGKWISVSHSGLDVGLIHRSSRCSPVSCSICIPAPKRAASLQRAARSNRRRASGPGKAAGCCGPCRIAGRCCCDWAWSKRSLLTRQQAAPAVNMAPQPQPNPGRVGWSLTVPTHQIRAPITRHSKTHDRHALPPPTISNDFSTRITAFVNWTSRPSFTMAPAAPPLPTRFPCWCRAVYSWGGEVCPACVYAC
jgi:hypothetical protein